MLGSSVEASSELSEAGCAQRDLALADWGEISTVRLQFTKGVTSPGGASGNLAPEIHEGIGSVGDGERVELDYSKNDVFAVSRPDPFGSSILL